MPLYNSRQVVVIWILIFMWGCALLFQKGPRMNTVQPLPACPVFVCEIKGHVPTEGFYCFEHQPTIASLLTAAGRPDLADAYRFHGTIPNGACITVASNIETAHISAAARLNFFMPIPLSTASVEDLMLIPGMGDNIARAIIAYRDQHTRICDLHDIISIPGIGEKKFKLFSSYLTL